MDEKNNNEANASDNTNTKRILIIEDDASVRIILSTYLELQNYEVLEAENGKEGFEVALKNIPDLIISDIMMPVMDGYETLKLLRETPEMSNIPVIFLTAVIHQESKDLSQSLGVTDYIVKPFHPKDILSVIEDQFKK